MQFLRLGSHPSEKKEVQSQSVSFPAGVSLKCLLHPLAFYRYGPADSRFNLSHKEPLTSCLLGPKLENSHSISREGLRARSGFYFRFVCPFPIPKPLGRDLYLRHLK
ncbi:hypothetical protein ACOSQ3_021276 [Xanthoceras sorbifolium]